MTRAWFHRYRNPLILATVALGTRLVLAFIVSRAGWTFVGPNSPDFWESGDGYIVLGKNLAETGRLAYSPDEPPTVYRGPAFPAAIAAAYLAVRSLEWAVLAVNAVCAAVTVLLMYAIALRFYATRQSFWIALIASFYPPAVHYALWSWSETFLTMAFVLYVWATLHAVHSRGWLMMMGSGLALALVLLTKTVFALLPIAALILCVLFRRRWVLTWAVQIVVAAAVLTPWTVRNYQVVDRFTFVTVGGGFNLLVGTYMTDREGDCSDTFRHAVSDALKYLDETRDLNISRDDLRPGGFLGVHPDLDHVFFEAGVERMLQQPGRFMHKMLVNLGRFWYYASSPMRCLVLILLNFPILVLAAAELWRKRGERPTDIIWIVLSVEYVWLMYSAIIVHSRFYLPVMPLLLPFALARLFELARPKRPAVQRTTRGAKTRREERVGVPV